MNECSVNLRKAMLLALLSTVLLLLMGAVLLGCSSSTLAGTWVGETGISDEYGFYYDATCTLVIKDDDTYSMEWSAKGRILGTDYGSTYASGDVKVSGTTVNLYYDDQGSSIQFEYAVATNGKETLTDVDGLELVKQGES